MNNKKFRWRYFIDKPFQLRFIYRFSVLIIISLGVFLVALGVVNYYRYNRGLYVQYSMDPVKLKAIDAESTADKIKDTIVLQKYFDLSRQKNLFQIYWRPLVGMSVIYIFVIALFGLFISHKMAGPVYRIKRDLEDAANGKMDLKTLRFRLRRGDELKDLVASLNNFLEKTKACDTAPKK